MTGAMYAAIAGLKSHMQKLNVIGNNIANVNTAGYKSQSMKFSEALYATVKSGADGTAITGGMNPAQLGYGCNVGTIDLAMGTGPYVPDGEALHCMIDGDGFFMVGDKPEFDEATGTYKPVDPESRSLTRVGDFRFDSDGFLVDGQKNVVYGFVTVTGNENGTNDGLNTVSTQLVPIRLPQRAPKPADDAGDDAVAEGTPLFPTLTPGAADEDKLNLYGKNGAVTADGVSIDENGKIIGVDPEGKSYVIGYIPLAKVPNPSGVTHIQGPYYKALEGAGDVSVVSIKGAVEGFMNNNTRGAKIEGAGETTMMNAGLEGSGTDLATEISEMITTQRGYQANTRIITVTDSMLEELVNMKR